MAAVKDILAELKEILGADELSEAKKKDTSASSKKKGRPGSKKGTGGQFIPAPKPDPKPGEWVKPPSPHKHAFKVLVQRKVDALTKEQTSFYTQKKKNEATYIAQHTKDMSKTAKAAFIRKRFPDHNKSVKTLVDRDVREKFPLHGKSLGKIGFENLRKSPRLKKRFEADIKAKQERNEKKRTSSHHTFLHPKGSGHPDERRTVTTARVRDAHSGFVRAHNPFKTRSAIGKTDFTAGSRGPRSVHRKGEWSCRKIASYTQMCSKLRDKGAIAELKHRAAGMQDQAKDASPKQRHAMLMGAQKLRAKLKKPLRMKVHINKEYKTKYDHAYKKFEKRKRHAEKGTEHHIDADTRATLHHGGSAKDMHGYMGHSGSNRHIGKKYSGMPHHRPGKPGERIPDKAYNTKSGKMPSPKKKKNP